METVAVKILCSLIGLAGIWTGFRQLRNRTVLNGWKTTTGKVIERGVYEPQVVSFGGRGFSYAPLIKYVYQIGMQEFVNDCIRPKLIQSPETGSRKWAQKKADSFADEVTVHYNPDAPGESFLIQTSKNTLYLVIGVSITVILFEWIFM